MTSVLEPDEGVLATVSFWLIRETCRLQLHAAFSPASPHRSAAPHRIRPDISHDSVPYAY